MAVSIDDARVLRLKLALSESTQGHSRDPRNVSRILHVSPDDELEQMKECVSRDAMIAMARGFV